MRYATLGLALLAAASPAYAARTVVYPIDPATIEKDAVEQGLTASPAPPRGTHQLTLKMAPTVDHEVVRAGIMCGVWTVDNPIRALITAMATEHDPDGKLDPIVPAGLTVEIDRASTLSRCVSNGEMSAMCITRVAIAGSVTADGGTPRALHVEVEKTAKQVGACAGLTRGIGLISREAVIALLAEVDGS